MSAVFLRAERRDTKDDVDESGVVRDSVVAVDAVDVVDVMDAMESTERRRVRSVGAGDGLRDDSEDEGRMVGE